MSNQRLTVKRRASRKGAVRKLFANVARKKKRHRAATAAPPADFEGDMPNLGIGRALIVILVIHVVAIAGIFFHSHWLDGESAGESTAALTKSKVLEIPASEAGGRESPKIRQGDNTYRVGVGDTWEVIARRLDIDEMELRSANREFTEIRHNDVLRVPPKAITAVEPPEIAELRSAPREPVVVEPAVDLAEESLPAMPDMVTTEAARRVDAREAEPEAAPASAPAASGKTYKVEPGDTFWAIAQKHGTSVDKLMSLNGIDDPRRLRPGMDLKLPR